jgi:UPF0716 protein FxsA
MWLFLLFLTIPLIEIGLFIQIGGFLGLWPTLGIVVLTAILGTALVRSQGAVAIAKLRRSFDELNDPTEPLAHGAMILFSGALLLTPGFFTDAIGFLLLIPGVRSFAYNYLRRRMAGSQFAYGRTGAHDETRSGVVIDGEYEELSPTPKPGDSPSGWTRH